mmetsp:Transcript_1511/g.1620  ORF Transcript_1511/g.1620 Transcript_1511/m.1620 type:complete len:135 (-) Transcript_1511:147-551(-)
MSPPMEDVVKIAHQQLLEWEHMKEQLGLLKGNPLPSIEELLRVLAHLEGSSDPLKEGASASCTCSTTSVASMASLPSSDDSRAHVAPSSARPKFEMQKSKRVEMNWLNARVTRRYSQSRDLTIRVGSPRPLRRI